jgi:AraC-like DNA-binding protein
MNMNNTADKYYYLDNIYVENLMHGQTVVHRLEKAGWILDLVLDGIVKINEISLAESSWQLSYCEIGDRIIQAGTDRTSEILSLFLYENTYADARLAMKNTDGIFNVTFAYPILRIISCLKNPVQHVDINMWIGSYIRLLMAQLGRVSIRYRSIKYPELKKVYFAISEIENGVDYFPTPAEIVRRSRMQKSRFQIVCLELYRQSAQKIIQHFKMTRAFKEISVEKETITNTSDLLGYKHSPNFITAFHEHFAITPFDISQKSDHSLRT